MIIGNNLLININVFIFKKIRKYLDICLQGIVYNKKYTLTNKNIKISVIIPIFNCENSIKLSINSIENQNLQNFEIILINDFSTDNSKIVIENIQKEEPRIFIINNNKNMGTLYSRNIGVLAARGKYILALDNDDLFINEDLFHKIYKEAEKKKYDIIEFKTIIGYNYYSNITEMKDDPFIKNKNNIVVYQPELSLFSLTNNDVHIWGKGIKTEIYKKAVNYLGKRRYSIYLCYSEDDVMIFLLFKLSDSFKSINKYGLFHLISNKTASFYLSKNHILFSKIYFMNFLFDYTKNNFEEKKYVVIYSIKFLNRFFSKISLNKENRDYLNLVLKKILNTSFISENDKQILITKFKNFTSII